MGSMDTKLRLKLQHGITRIRVLILHPTETGRRRDDQNRLVPTLFVEKVMIEHNGKLIAECHFGVGMSHNPYFTVHYQAGKPGDCIKVSWLDNTGQTESAEAHIEER